jgi:acetolactate synthase-1/2/3 large subunit
MTEQAGPRSGGQILVDALRIHGTDTAYCVPGESFLAVIDAFYGAKDDIKLVVCRQEGGAAHMAEAHGKLTGEPGICFVTRGPGATNASIGIHTARQDSTPLIMFVGQVGRDAMGREAWQEIDYRHMYGHIAKWVEQIDDARRIPEYVSRAFHVATSGRPGPVVLALPEDMLTDMVTVADSPRYKRHENPPPVSALEEMQAMLAQAKQPLVVLGGGAWSRQAGDDMARFAEAFDLPVACAFRRQDLFDNCHSHYVGEAGLGMDPNLAARIKAADLVIAVGPRLGETSTNGYALFNVPKPVQRLVHVHRDPNELGRVYAADLPINAGMEEFARAAAALKPAAPAPWKAWTAAAREDYLNNLKHTPMQGPVDLGEVMKHVRETLPADSIITNGAGNYTLWVQRFYQYRGFRTQLAPSSGTMGYGVPAAIAAKIVHPERTVVCFAGDGCFLMNGQEMATAMQYGLNIIVIVVNNSIYGSIRMHQEKHYPARVHGTDLVNPDFAALARAYGVHGELVERTEDFAPALARAMAVGKPALIELRTDPEVMSPRATVASLRKLSQAH